MVGPIESVTVAVSELERHRDFFQDQFGLNPLSDGHASVGLLSAWRYPVHESVRLTELAHGTQPHGRVRLAVFEDSPMESSAARGTTDDRSISPGPRVLDFRVGVSDWKGTPVTMSGLPMLIKEPSRRRGALGSVWVLSADFARARRFYVEALGYRLVHEADVTVGAGAPCFEGFGFNAGTALRLAHLNAAKATAGGILLVGLVDCELPIRASRLGALGINLLTCRCDDLDDLIERLSPFEIEPVAAPSHVGLPDGRLARVMVAHGPSNEAFEFIEIED
jgi:catechol 2,3-dioxygenase-like lactoylglutathione lyase family enzyme